MGARRVDAMPASLAARRRLFGSDPGGLLRWNEPPGPVPAQTELVEATEAQPG